MEPKPEQTPAGMAVPRLGMAAIVIMAAGYGWVGGNFSTATDTLPVKLAITLGHLIFPPLWLCSLACWRRVRDPRRPAARSRPWPGWVCSSPRSASAMRWLTQTRVPSGRTISPTTPR
jgi:hypothetical protein